MDFYEFSKNLSLIDDCNEFGCAVGICAFCWNQIMKINMGVHWQEVIIDNCFVVFSIAPMGHNFVCRDRNLAINYLID